MGLVYFFFGFKFIIISQACKYNVFVISQLIRILYWHLNSLENNLKYWKKIYFYIFDIQVIIFKMLMFIVNFGFIYNIFSLYQSYKDLILPVIFHCNNELELWILKHLCIIVTQSILKALSYLYESSVTGEIQVFLEGP